MAKETNWELVQKITKSGWAVMMDSTRTEDVLEVEEISSVFRMNALAQKMAESPSGLSLLSERPMLDSSQVDFDALRALPEGTLGHEFAWHLKRAGLDPDIWTPVTRGNDALCNYVLTRIRHTHDLWHVLTGLSTEGHDEVLLHAFELPQLGLPYSVIIMLFGGLKHLVGEGRWAMIKDSLWEGVQAGKDAEFLLAVRWEDLWEEKISDVRQRFGIRPAMSWRGWKPEAQAA